MTSGDFLTFVAEGFSDSSVDKVGVENCELRLDHGFNFEDGCRKSVRLTHFLRFFKIE